MHEKTQGTIFPRNSQGLLLLLQLSLFLLQTKNNNQLKWMFLPKKPWLEEVAVFGIDQMHMDSHIRPCSERCSLS